MQRCGTKTNKRKMLEASRLQAFYFEPVLRFIQALTYRERTTAFRAK